MGSLCPLVTPTAWSCSLSPSDCATSSPDIHVCLPSQFKCTNTNRCIPGIFRCNGQDNCGDGEDEKDCREWGAQGVRWEQAWASLRGSGLCLGVFGSLGCPRAFFIALVSADPLSPSPLFPCGNEILKSFEVGLG